MSKIRILPEIISNKIAAGEIVERPSSVVKELIENAIDAASSIITIDIKKGGRSLIRVSDNGTGMNHDDALLALERYATSKIFNDSDLFSISTLGFRGEALPSIASVSKFSIVTRDAASEAGTEIIVEGGRIKKVSETGAPTGTMVTVEQLFYNTPARRKFLKTINTEMAHIADTVSSIALGWPDIQFKLIHNGKAVKSWPRVANLFDRAVDVLGRDIRNDLHEIKFEGRHISISGWISSPSATRSTSKKIYVYVNGRCVHDRSLQHALFEGYEGRLMKGRFPFAVLFIKIPFDKVDVNVHPTKHEVRFGEHRKIYEALKGAVTKIWNKVDHSKWSDDYDINYKEPAPEKSGLSGPLVSDSFSRYTEIQEKVSLFDYGNKSDIGPDKPAGAIDRAFKSCVHEDSAWNETGPQPVVKRQESADQSFIWKKNHFSGLKIIGQIHNTYIACESEKGLVIIDQHAAHERILFERLKKRSASSKGFSQRLLIPETIDLGYSEAVLLEKMIPDLNEIGLEMEPFGGNTFVVKSAPALLADKELKPVITEMVEKVAEIGVSPDMEKAINECLILMACHGAVRANHLLSDKEMKALLNQLDECENPSHCPHGRPIWIRWTLKDLEKNFKRIV